MNTEEMKTHVDQAKAALDLASAYHAGALLAVQDKQDDPKAKHSLEQAVKRGKVAWKAYRKAATESFAAEIDAFEPGVFREE